jgi:hypothetical protein
MNERIRELATQADLFQILSNGNLYPTAMTAEQSIAAYQRFAQLILGDVIRITDDTVVKWEPDDLIAKFKEHFGVEE